jgi:hypothetical protein
LLTKKFLIIHALQAHSSAGYSDGFVAKLADTGSDLMYSTYFRRVRLGLTFRIGVDLFGSASVIGFTDFDWLSRSKRDPAEVRGRFFGLVRREVNRNGSRAIYSTASAGPSISVFHQTDDL